MTKLVSFRRRRGEPIDQAIARFDLLKHRARHLGNFNLAPPALAWMLLNSLGVPPTQQAQFLVPTQGN
eukprot:6703239-Prorocentrum_lima.AAC.1